MNRALVATAGLALLALTATAGCSADKDTPAAPKPTPAASSSTASPAASTSAASAPASTTTVTVTASSAGPTSNAPMVGGMTECTKEALAKPATAAAQELGPNNLYTVDQLSCSNGWAVTSGVLSSKDNPDMGAPTSFVFEQEGQFWVPKEKSAVCGTNPVGTTAPPDATIPADLFLAGCAAG